MILSPLAISIVENEPPEPPVSEMITAKKGGFTIRGFKGGKGGGGSSGASETPDNLHSTSYARLLYLLGEGQLHWAKERILKEIYLDGTPIVNEDESYNYQDVVVDFREGSQDQDIIGGFPSSESEMGVGVELRAATPWTQSFTDTELSACRITLAIAGLSYTNTKNGNIGGHSVAYEIDLQTDGGAWKKVVSTSFSGKTTSTYYRTHRIEFPAADYGWNVRVRRLTPNSSSATIADTTQIVSYAKVIDVKLRYPNSALLGIKIDARQFSSIPSVQVGGSLAKIIQVPSNYDPETRKYAGVWDGTFRLGVSDNPVWVFYDLISNERYGVGTRVPAERRSELKWQLYPIGRYCDELVPDGFGGQEPRYTCNICIQSRDDSYKVLSDLASVFRGMVYAVNGGLYVSADMPKEIGPTFTNANVIDGKFSRAGTTLDTRYNLALASWRDNSALGEAKVEAVHDPDAPIRGGIRQTETTAYGSTSRGQAMRAAKWELLTSRRRTQTQTFEVALEHALVQPGDWIRISDQHLAGRRVGGRIAEVIDGANITLDAPLAVRPGDRLVVNLPSGASESRVITSASAGLFYTADSIAIKADSTAITADQVGGIEYLTEVRVQTAFSEIPQAGAVWTIESEELSSQKYGVFSITRTGKNTAAQVDPDLYDATDFGTILSDNIISVVPASQGAPKDVLLSSWEVLSQGVSSTNVTIKWIPAANAIEHEVQWRRDYSNWVAAGRTGAASLDVPGIYAGDYVARVRSYNATGAVSPWTLSAATTINGLLDAPPAVATLIASDNELFAITLGWTFPSGANIIAKTEIWYAKTSDRSQSVKLCDTAYPQNGFTLPVGAGGTAYHFWVKLVDKNGLEGAFYPSGAGVRGVSSYDANGILGMLSGQIAETQLAKSLVGRIDLIDAKDTVSGSVNARLKTETTARTTADGALSGRIDQVQAVANANSAAVETNAQAIADTNGDLSAMYTIKTQATANGRTYMAGIGVGVENDKGKIESQVLVHADRFGVINTDANATVTSPFVIQNGQTYISKALIGDAWIKSAQIDSLDSKKITADWLDAGKIKAKSIDTGMIKTGAITTDLITMGGVTTDTLLNNAVTQVWWRLKSNTLTVTSKGGYLMVDWVGGDLGSNTYGERYFVLTIDDIVVMVGGRIGLSYVGRPEAGQHIMRAFVGTRPSHTYYVGEYLPLGSGWATPASGGSIPMFRCLELKR